jgi:hypothetical protein
MGAEETVTKGEIPIVIGIETRKEGEEIVFCCTGASQNSRWMSSLILTQSGSTASKRFCKTQ